MKRHRSRPGSLLAGLAVLSLLLTLVAAVACGGSSGGVLSAGAPVSTAVDVAGAGSTPGGTATTSASQAPAGSATASRPTSSTTAAAGSPAVRPSTNGQTPKAPDSAGSTPGPGSTTTVGNALAGGNEVAGVYASFAALKSVSMSVQTGPGFTGWSVNQVRPDKTRYYFSGGPQGTAEFIVIGSDTYSRDGSSSTAPWSKQGNVRNLTPPNLQPVSDALQKISANQKTMTKTASPDNIAGQKCQSYADDAGSLSVCIANGLPLYLTFPAPNGTKTSVTFSGFNTVADIKAPI